MAKGTLSEIIGLCLELDQKAHIIYREFCKRTEDKELREFWEDMAADESEHVLYWEELLQLAKNDLVPDMFNDPDEVRDELAAIKVKVEELYDNAHKAPSVENDFLAAFRIEFFMLHQAFTSLFNFTKKPQTTINPADKYEGHINKFMNALMKYGKDAPDLQLLADVLKRLWNENKSLAKQSLVDPLTGVFNRRGFFDAVKPLAYLAQRNQFTVAVMMLDIDNFKSINDTRGHIVGDDILKAFADVLKLHIRTSDISGRYGGDEFIVYFSSIDKNFIEAVAENIRQLVNERTKTMASVTISIGLCYGVITEKIEETLMVMIQEADACLYDAKTSGRDKVMVKELK
ncbi:MAG: diguanylate cyclase [Candidatus Omnitrophica bacterium]|nr:diguanylate cyclase [Candidatus Omnitrophota bacterium]